jgi:hypothetical protein
MVRLQTGFVGKIPYQGPPTILLPLGVSPDGTRLFGTLGGFPTAQIVEIDGTDCSVSPPIAFGVR